MNRLIVIVSLVCLSFSIFAQKPVYRHYTVNDGLPDNEVYFAMQDSKGYMWFATNSGVSRFNGYEFENFSVNDGLAENSILEIYEDLYGRIWFIPFDCQFSYYKDGEIKEYKYNKTIADSLGVLARYGNFSFSVDTLDNVCFSGTCLVNIDPNGECTIEGLSLKDRRGVKVCHSEKNYQKKSVSRFNLFVDNKDLFQKTGVSTSDTLWLLYTNPSISSFRGQCLSIVHADDFLLFARNNVLFFTDDFKEIQVKEFQKRITFIEYDAPYLYLGFLKEGVHVYHIGEFDKPKQTFLEGYSVTSRVKDTQHGQWFSTLYNGVFHQPNEHIRVYAFDEDTLNKQWYLELFDGGILASTLDGTLLDPINKKVIKVIPDEILGAMANNPNDGYLYMGGKYLYKYDGEELSKTVNNHKFYVKVRTNAFSVKSMLFSDDEIWVGGSSNLYRLSNDQVDYCSFIEDQLPLRSQALCMSTDRVLWIGSGNGLWKYFDGDYFNLGDTNQLLASGINDMCFSVFDSSLIICTNGTGLLIHRNGQVDNITVEDGLLSNSIHVIFQQDSILWLGSNLGLNEVVIKDTDPLRYTVHSYTINDGLPDNKINDILFYQDQLYLATEKGTTELDVESIKSNYSSIPVYIDRVKILNRDTVLIQDMRLDYDMNFIDLSFIGVSLLDNGQVKYRYKLEGLHNDWQLTYDRNIKFASLAPGVYQFKVCAQNKAGIWSEPATFTFIISKPYWNTLGFKIMCIMLVLIFFILIMKYRIDRVKKETQLKEDVILMRQKALSKQIDPHFIYNSLNSIQSFILKNNNIVAVKYLAKFSKLMRKVLNNSTQSFVSIADEIQAITLYLELERVRFNKKFEFEIAVDPWFEQEITYMPSFFIQPFVENSIWHGFNGGKADGFVKISLIKDQDSVRVLIQDNGVGVNESRKQRKIRIKDHVSMGIDITTQRLELINKLHDSMYEVVISDNSEMGESQTGTTVGLQLPYLVNNI